MTIAWVENGVVSEVRGMTLESVPAHKRSLWRPVEGDPPAYNSDTEMLRGPTYQVFENRVVQSWEIIPRPAATEAERVAQLEAQVAALQTMLAALVEEASK